MKLDAITIFFCEFSERAAIRMAISRGPLVPSGLMPLGKSTKGRERVQIGAALSAEAVKSCLAWELAPKQLQSLHLQVENLVALNEAVGIQLTASARESLKLRYSAGSGAGNPVQVNP